MLRNIRCDDWCVMSRFWGEYFIRIEWDVFPIRIDIFCVNVAVVCRRNHNYMALIGFLDLVCIESFLQQSMTSNHIQNKFNARYIWICRTVFTWIKNLLITCGFNSPVHRLKTISRTLRRISWWTRTLACISDRFIYINVFFVRQSETDICRWRRRRNSRSRGKEQLSSQ